MNTTEEYNMFVDVVRRSKPHHVNNMLECCNDLLPILREDPAYKKLKADPPLVEALAIAQSKLLRADKSPGLMWYLGLRTLAKETDPNIFMMQFALFIAAQELKFKFIEDNAIRLSLTYLHLRLFRHILEKHYND